MTLTNGQDKHTPPGPGRRDPRMENLLGERRGRLEVIGMARTDKKAGRDRVTYWSIRCNCGETVEMRARQFRTHTACPRCEHIEDFIAGYTPKPNQEFTLQSFSHYRTFQSGKHGQYVWNCLCQCGKTFKVASNKLSGTERCPACSVKRMGARARGRSQGKKNIPTPEIIKLVEEAYGPTGAGRRKNRQAPTLRQIAEITGWEVSALKSLGTDLGLARPAPRPARAWTREETQIVTELRNASQGRIKAVLREQGYVHSRNEIRDKLTEIGHLEHGPQYTPEEVARLLGFDGPERVAQLVALGKLGPISPTAGTQEEKTPLIIARAALKSFLLGEPGEYTLARTDRIFFILLVLKNAFEDDTATTTGTAAAEDETEQPG